MEKDFNDILAKPLYGLSDDEYATINGSATHFPDGIASKLWGQVRVHADDMVQKALARNS
jgi:hypothetical protein